MGGPRFPSPPNPSLPLPDWVLFDFGWSALSSVVSGLVAVLGPGATDNNLLDSDLAECHRSWRAG